MLIYPLTGHQLRFKKLFHLKMENGKDRPDQEGVESTYALTCSRGHNLKRAQMHRTLQPGSGCPEQRRCNICSEVQQQGSTSLACQACAYFVCHACSVSKTAVQADLCRHLEDFDTVAVTGTRADWTCLIVVVAFRVTFSNHFITFQILVRERTTSARCSLRHMCLPYSVVKKSTHLPANICLLL